MEKFLSILMLIILLPINQIVYSQQPITNGVLKGSALVNGDKRLPINFTIAESKVFGNYSNGPINNSSLMRILLGNITRIHAANSTLIININSSIGVALTIKIPRMVSTAVTNNLNSKGGEQISPPVSINGQQVFALICPIGNATKVFIPSISHNSQNITINLNPKIFKDNSIDTCNHIT